MAFEDDPRRAARKNSFGDAAAAMSGPNVTQVQAAPAPTTAPKPAQAAGAQMTALPGAAPATQAASPAAPNDSQRIGSLVSQIPGNGAAPTPAADGSQWGWRDTELGRNVSNTMMAIPGAAAVPFAGARTAGALAGLAGRAAPAATMTGQMAARAGPAGVPLLAAAGIGATYNADKARPQVAASPADAGPGAANPAVVNPAVVNPSGAPPEPAMPLPGIYRQGNSYSDLAAGLATSSTEPQPAYAANTIPLIQAAGISHSGNDFASRKALENAATSASSIMNNGGRFDSHGKAGSPAQAAYGAMLANDTALQGAQPGLLQAAMRENGATARTQMQEQGATGRSLVSMALEQQKVNQAGEAWGYTNRANKLVEAARNQVAAERDPGKRRNLVQYMQDLEGKSQQADPYLVVPGGQQVDEMGKPYNMPSSVFNRQTQQFVQQPAQKAAVSDAAASALRANPKRAADFDAKYGAGAASRILGS